MQVVPDTYKLTADEMWVESSRKADKSKKITLMFGEYWANMIGELKKLEGDDNNWEITLRKIS